MQRWSSSGCQEQNRCMKKQFAICALILISIISCSKKIDSPLPENLKAMINNNNNCSCQPYLNLYEWKGKQVYQYSNRGPACNSVPAYYDIEGKPLMMIAIYTQDQFLSESRLLKVIWECK